VSYKGDLQYFDGHEQKDMVKQREDYIKEIRDTKP